MCVYGWDERNRNIRMIKTFAFSIDCSKETQNSHDITALMGEY